jgi:uncharacterized protein YdeI (YjbR/CyaY-like superfamily)
MVSPRKLQVGETYYAADRAAWRRWLEKNHARADEIWLVYPKKESGEPRIPYNDAVDEALCFGWIDSTLMPIDARRYAQRFTPRREKSKLSPMNRERALRLIAAGWMTPAGLRAIQDQLKGTRKPVAADILAALKSEPRAWANFQRFPASYRRVRIGWIEGARVRPDVFQKRLAYFVKMTAQNKKYGMVQ